MNLTICENTKISVNIPFEINGNKDKLNTSSGYFNDICYAATLDDGTDISLQDRKNEYINGDNIICQNGCDFSDYDSKHKKAKCECIAKESNLSFAEMIINKTQLFDNIKDIRNLVNMNILLCYKILLSIISLKGIIHNAGSLILSCIFLFHTISVFIFYIRQYKKILQKIKDIVFAIKNFNLVKKTNNKKNTKSLTVKNSKKNNKKEILKNKLKKSKRTKNNRINNNIHMLNNNYIKNNINITSNIIQTNKMKSNTSIIGFNKNKKDNKNKIEKIKNIMSNNIEELNVLSYDLALTKDKRVFCQYYTSLLKYKHNFIFSFFNNEDYNPKIIKMELFFIGFASYFTVNALFFNDDTIHKIYVKKGKYDLETQIPIAIYSSLISIVFKTPLTLLGLSNDRIIGFKHNYSTQGIKRRSEELTTCLKFKFVLYYIISFIFLLFFWYYITMFGVIYKNTQYHLLKDTLISFGVSLLSPFCIYLLPGIFRIPSLSNKKRKRKCLYNFIKILQLI